MPTWHLRFRSLNACGNFNFPLIKTKVMFSSYYGCCFKHHVKQNVLCFLFFLRIQVAPAFSWTCGYLLSQRQNLHLTLLPFALHHWENVASCNTVPQRPLEHNSLEYNPVYPLLLEDSRKHEKELLSYSRKETWICGECLFFFFKFCALPGMILCYFIYLFY